MSTEHEEASWSRQAAPGPPDRAGPGGDGRSPRSERSVWPSTTSTDRRSPSPAVHDGGLHRERDAAGTRPLGVLVVLRPHADPRRLAHRRIRRAHHGRRIRMVGASACLWSICTGLTFLASGFGTLFGLRPGLGIGEAGAHPACTRGHPNICRHRTAFGYQLDGGLPQHVRIPADARRNLVPVNNVPPLEAAIVEPVSCALNGQNLAEVAGARTILVAGAGPLGLIRMRLARVQGSPRSSRSNRTRPGTRSPGRPAPTPSRPRAATSRTGSGTSPRRGSTSSSWRSDAPRP